MWFKVKNVHSVITVGKGEMAWNELAELAALTGAVLHFHVCYDPDTSSAGTTRRRALWYTMYFNTFTATVNAGNPSSLANPSTSANGSSSIWDRMPGYQTVSPSTVNLFHHFTGNRLVQAGTGDQIVYASRTVVADNKLSLFEERGRAAATPGVSVTIPWLLPRLRTRRGRRSNARRHAGALRP
jgi:hypothetical protein